MFQDKVVVVTGGAHGIGLATAEEFRKAGAKVYVIDKAEGDWYVGDLAKKEVLEDFAKVVIEQSGHIDYLINNALPIKQEDRRGMGRNHDLSDKKQEGNH